MSRAILIAAACLVLTACNKPQPPAPAQPDEPVPAMPRDNPGSPAGQMQVVSVIAGDDCASFQQDQAFDNWVVTVDDVETSTVNQSIDVTFGAGHKVGLEQVVQTKDPLYHAVAALHVGDTVHVSGHFTHGNSECSYKLTTVGIALSRLS